MSETLRDLNGEKAVGLDSRNCEGESGAFEGLGVLTPTLSETQLAKINDRLEGGLLKEDVGVFSTWGVEFKFPRDDNGEEGVEVVSDAVGAVERRRKILGGDFIFARSELRVGVRRGVSEETL